MSSNTPFKPSPLSFGSPRASPFRRPSTPNSPPTPGRQTTPGSSPGRGHTPMVSPSKLNQSYTVEDEHDGYEVSPRTLERAAQPIVQPIPPPNFTRELPLSPTKRGSSPGHSPSMLRPRASNSRLGGASVSGDAAANLTPVQLREIREAFQVLDRDNDGSVNREDVADVLGNIGVWTLTKDHFFCFFLLLLTVTARTQLVCVATILPPRGSSDHQLPHVLNHTVQPRHSALLAPGAAERPGRL